MPLFVVKPTALQEVPRTTFAAAQIKEREHLQAFLRDDISAVADDVLVVAEEFGDFEDANRRIDLLGIDRHGNLVVIELKRTEDGGHMELQALRYAAMVRTMTFDQLINVYDKHLTNHPDGKTDDARARLDEWLEEEGVEALGTDVRIVLVSANFGKEITGTVLWLNEYGLDIRCIRTVPYILNGDVVLDVQQVIPLPEATDYQVKIRQKQALIKASPATNHDLTKFRVTDSFGVSTPPLPKRKAVLAVVKAVVAAGVPAETIAGLLSESRFRRVPGIHTPESTPAAFAEAHPTAELRRFFTEDPIVGESDTFVLTKMWGLNTPNFLDLLIAQASTSSVSYESVDE
jgi:hypothetical protein